MDNLVSVILVGALFGLCGFLLGAMNTPEIPDPSPCPVSPESTVVCGYVERDRPNHAGLYIRGTGCGPYNFEDRP